MFSLAGRVALITGAASGIGAATAQIFAEAGADLALAWYPPNGHDIEPVRRAAEKTGRRVVVAEVDVTRAADVDALVARAVRDFGGMHIVVANAGIARKVQLADLDDAAWNKALDVNLNCVWRCFRAALPHMQRAGRVGNPEDIAYVYLFLASAAASYVNGQLLVVDGARSLAGLD